MFGNCEKRFIAPGSPATVPTATQRLGHYPGMAPPVSPAGSQSITSVMPVSFRWILVFIMFSIFVVVSMWQVRPSRAGLYRQCDQPSWRAPLHH
jgi:hypothetical protein